MFVEYCSAKLDCISHRHRLGAVRRLYRAIQRRFRFRFHITLCARQVSDHRADVRSERSRRGTPLQTFADTGRCRRFPVRSPSLQHAKPICPEGTNLLHGRRSSSVRERRRDSLSIRLWRTPEERCPRNLPDPC